jgi:hypothetical protein
MNIHKALATELSKELGAVLCMPVITSDNKSSWYGWTFDRGMPTPKYNKFSTVYIVIFEGKIGLGRGLKSDLEELHDIYELADPKLLEHLKGYLTHFGIIPV